MKAAALRKLPEELRPRDIHDRLLNLYDEGFAAHYQWRMSRTAPPKCLNCGHSAYILIDENKRETGITHEDCWNSPIELQYPPIGSGLYGREITCYHALSGEVNWIHIYESAAFSCMIDHPCQADLREAAYAIIRKNFATALDILQTLARDGISAATTGLGALYQTGMGIEPDGSTALHYLSKALEAGDGVAAANLAMLYRFGSAGIDKDEQTSWSYARTARKMGIFLC
ncbi:tetratricopeptide repeat protein [Undibacterium sp. TC4M20W]|uniref:tetratricopeptide repeat protein n=1 Tax=unclassified Undibacterium TaxID=2630295 RepID=UPI003BF2A5A6